MKTLTLPPESAPQPAVPRAADPHVRVVVGHTRIVKQRTVRIPVENGAPDYSTPALWEAVQSLTDPRLDDYLVQVMPQLADALAVLGEFRDDVLGVQARVVHLAAVPA